MHDLHLKGKKILLAITGSIAAYKAPLLVRGLVQAGAEVQILLSYSASSIVSPLTLATLSQRPVLQTLVSKDNTWHNHVALGYWADLMLVAPLSAHSLSKMANGVCDNIIDAVFLSAKCRVMVAPAMDSDMWQHPSVQRNIETLIADGVQVLPVGFGSLASGLNGPGRMLEPEELQAAISAFFLTNAPNLYQGKKALVTAGPTYEPLDPVRFIGNRSSGKMGISICQSLLNKGFEVTLVAGPGVPAISRPNLQRVDIQTAEEMMTACEQHFPEVQLGIMTAAVADFRPLKVSSEKLKKQDGIDELEIKLVKNPDILATLGAAKSKDQLLVGFALETQNGLDHGFAKLERKNADFIALNSLSKENQVFGADSNTITLLGPNGLAEDLGTFTKDKLADKLIDRILALKSI